MASIKTRVQLASTFHLPTVQHLGYFLSNFHVFLDDLEEDHSSPSVTAEIAVLRTAYFPTKG